MRPAGPARDSPQVDRSDGWPPRHREVAYRTPLTGRLTIRSTTREMTLPALPRTAGGGPGRARSAIPPALPRVAGEPAATPPGRQRPLRHRLDAEPGPPVGGGRGGHRPRDPPR